MVLPDFDELRRQKAKLIGKSSSSGSSSSSAKKTASEKNKPLEFSCKKAVHVPRPRGQGLTVKSSKSANTADPRFNPEVSGGFHSGRFADDFSFLDDYRQSERSEMKQRLSSRKTSEEEKQEIERQLTRMESQDIARKRASIESSVRDELRTRERDLIEKTGKKAYFHPRSMVKKIIQDRQETDLRKSGKWEQFNAKKERRQVAKERATSSMPPRSRRVVEV